MAKIWLIDKECPAPQGYSWAHMVDEAIYEIMYREREKDFIFKRYIVDDLDWEKASEHLKVYRIEEISCGDSEDSYKLLSWLEATGRSYPIRIHSQNVVGVQNMRRIIERNGWKEVF